VRKFCSSRCYGHWLRENLVISAETRAKISATTTGKPRPNQQRKLTTNCEQCGKPFTFPPSQKRRFCSKTCSGKWHSLHAAEVNNHFRGKKAHNAKEYVALICPTCGTTYHAKPSHAHRRRYCSYGCMAEAYTEMTGERSPSWRGGTIKYYGPSWRKVSRMLRNKYPGCQQCGKTREENGRELDVHHLVPFRTFGVARHLEANDPANLLVLCHTCHMEMEVEMRQAGG